MSTVRDIENAVEHLPEDQLREFRTWFERYDSEKWDAELEKDVRSGKLDGLAGEALSDFDCGKCSDL